MSEQSSASVMFRALVMLTCLVAIPLAAIFGKSLPGLVKGLLEGHWGSESASASTSIDESSRFEPISPAYSPAPRELAPPWPATPLAAPGSEQGAAPPAAPGTAIAAAYQEPLAAPEAVLPASVSAPGQAAARADRFTYIQNRLRDLGASHRVLESWGPDLYRFHCRVPMATGDATCERHFEATDPGALKAMSDVLQQVETWCARRQK